MQLWLCKAFGFRQLQTKEYVERKVKGWVME